MVAPTPVVLRAAADANDAPLAFEKTAVDEAAISVHQQYVMDTDDPPLKFEAAAGPAPVESARPGAEPPVELPAESVVELTVAAQASDSNTADKSTSHAPVRADDWVAIASEDSSWALIGDDSTSK